MKNKKILVLFSFLLFAFVFVAPNVNAGCHHSWKKISTSYKHASGDSHYIIKTYKCTKCRAKKTEKRKGMCGGGYWVYSDDVKVNKTKINKNKYKYTITCKKCGHKWSETGSKHLWP